jgi:hypothetical protein
MQGCNPPAKRNFKKEDYVNMMISKIIHVFQAKSVTEIGRNTEKYNKILGIRTFFFVCFNFPCNLTRCQLGYDMISIPQFSKSYINYI